MLTQLPSTDLLSFAPDYDVDPFGVGFDVNSIPASPGVYAWYFPLVGGVLYIGSAGSAAFEGAGGLRQRLKDYILRDRTDKSRLMGIRAKEVGWRLKIWLAASEADARKYEADAIQIYRPPENVASKGPLSLQEQRARRSVYARRVREKRKKTVVYNPDALKTCYCCTNVKTCSEFRRSASKPMGVHGICKVCDNARLKAKRESK